MTEFDWKSYLKQHPLFSDVGDEDIEQLLTDGASREKSYSQDQIIVKEGEQGDSIYLIGQGTADVFLKVSHNQDIVLNSLGEGDTIGEMALFEQRPRSATATATESCILLEIENQAFAQLLKKNPEIGFRLLVILSEKLRNLGDNVLNDKLRDVDEKIRHVNAKLDTEIKVIDASLKATQTVFDQTSKRATEVINSAERRSRHFTVAGSVLGTIFTLILGILSYAGFDVKDRISSQVDNLDKLANEAKLVSEDTKKITDTANELAVNATEQLESIKVKSDFIDNIFFPRLKAALVAQFKTEVSQDFDKAESTYDSILSFKDEKISDDLYRQIVSEIFSGEENVRSHYTNVLKARIDDGREPFSNRQKILSFYILLSTYALNDDSSKYNEYLETFKAVVKNSESIKDEKMVANFGVANYETYIRISSDPIEKQEEKIAKIRAVWDLIE